MEDRPEIQHPTTENVKYLASTAEKSIAQKEHLRFLNQEQYGQQITSLCENLFGDETEYKDEIISAVKDDFGTWTINSLSHDEDGFSWLNSFSVSDHNRVRFAQNFVDTEAKAVNDDLRKLHINQKMINYNSDSFKDVWEIEKLIDRLQFMLISKVIKEKGYKCSPYLINSSIERSQIIECLMEASEKYHPSMKDTHINIGFRSSQRTEVNNALVKAGLLKPRVHLRNIPILNQVLPEEIRLNKGFRLIPQGMHLELVYD